MFSNIIQGCVNGSETAIALWSSPRYEWSLAYNFLRQGTINLASNTEFSTLIGFFNARYGNFDTFLYADEDDYQVTGQTISTGDGTTKDFQMIKSYGGFIEPVLAPNLSAPYKVYLDGVEQMSGYTISAWGASPPGVLSFSSAPANGKVITADFSYYYPCRFVNQNLNFSKFMSLLYECKKVSFKSVRA